MPTIHKTLSPMDRALSYLTVRDRTESEMRRYLKDKGFSHEDTEQTIERLKELNLIDDARYAEQFVRTRLATKPVSRYQLYQQLSGKLLSKDYIEQALESVPEESELENALSLTRKFFQQFSGLEEEKRRQRVLSRLQSRGFNYEISSRAYRIVNEEEEE